MTQIIRQERVTITKSILAGDELAKIESVLPGGADRVLRVMEKQAGHRQTIEAKVVGSNVLGERIGQLSGLIVALAGMYFGYDLLMHDKPIAGYTLALAPIITLASIFLVGKRKRDRDLAAKDMHAEG